MVTCKPFDRGRPAGRKTFDEDRSKICGVYQSSSGEVRVPVGHERINCRVVCTSVRLLRAQTSPLVYSKSNGARTFELIIPHSYNYKYLARVFHNLSVCRNRSTIQIYQKLRNSEEGVFFFLHEHVSESKFWCFFRPRCFTWHLLRYSEAYINLFWFYYLHTFSINLYLENKSVSVSEFSITCGPDEGTRL